MGSDNIVTVDAASTIQTAREHAGLSKRELARRAHTSPAAIVAYESGTRDPTVGTLARIVAATGAVGDIELGSGLLRPNPQVASVRLGQVLGLAEQLPRRRPSRRLAYPAFPRST
ncbi:MAG: XRE family transcriptional regulator [Acidimicrobiia bacterium]|nr:XRE family transcriptional regulator [Acidimicrobiia bacterium]